jgi:ureidoglycolate lyase
MARAFYKISTTIKQLSCGVNITVAIMPLKIQCPYSSIIEVRPLVEHNFSEFGTVIENPSPSLEPSASLQQLPPNAVRANQGTALKYVDVSQLLDLYGSAPSRVASKAVMNMFVCAPRALKRSLRHGIHGTFQVEILERHPFTTQTFIPLGLGRAGQEEARYLVIVAPSLPPSCKDESLPVPAQNPPAVQPPGRGLPDLTKMQAFMAQGSQAVTYGAGTWHAPMVVIGKKSVDFVVVQYANGIEIEDCQEVLIQSQGQGKIEVAVTTVRMVQAHGSLKL